MFPHPFTKNLWLNSRMIVFAGILQLLATGSTAWAQVTSSPALDATLTSYPGAKLPAAIQTDGKLLISGDSFLVGGVTQKGLARLNADWSLDTGFAIGTGTDYGTITTIVVQSDQKILVGGKFTSFSGQAAAGLVRLLPDGRIDPTFSYDGPGHVTRITQRAAGDYLVVDGSSQIRWHSATGALVRLLPLPVDLITESADAGLLGTDRNQNNNLTAIEVAELKNGTILGAFAITDKLVGHISFSRDIFAYSSDGLQVANWPVIRPVATVTGDIFFSGYPDLATRIIPTRSGGFYILCSGYQYSTMVPAALNRYNSDGSLDPSFAAPPMAFRTVFPTDLLGDFDSAGNLIVSGCQFEDPEFHTDFYWNTARLLDDGSIDPRFGVSAPGGYREPPSIRHIGYQINFVGVRKGTTPADDRVILYYGGLHAYKLTNDLSLGEASALPATQTVTTGKGVSFIAAQAGTNIQWQISTDNGRSWTNLTESNLYHGTTTATLDILNASPGLNGSLLRYISTTSRGSVSSNATSLNITPLFFPFPASIGIDGSNNLYVGDTASHTIQKVSPTLQVLSVAGSSGQTGAVDGLGTSALFNQPAGLTTTPTGDLTVSDTANGTLRRVTAAGDVSTFAGSSTIRANVDGLGSAARFSAPIGIAQNTAGTFYVADSTNHTIRKVTADGTVTTFAGTAGASGASDGTGAAARFNNPTGIAVDAGGNVFIADTTNNLIRKITPTGVVTTVAGVPAIAGSQDGTGTEALFNQPGGLGVNSAGDLYVADTGNSVVRKVTPEGVVTTIAGLPTVGGLKDGTGLDAWFNQPKSLTVAANGDIYVADTGNAAIRKINLTRVVTTLNLSASAPTITTQPAGLVVAAGGTASFTVVANGTNPLSYQWQKNGTPIPGATSVSYAILAANPSDAGNYSVVVSNSAGTVTSSAASLTVNAPPPSLPSSPPASQSGSGGGGGAPNLWFLSALSLLALVRGLRLRPE